jgi:integrase
MAAHLPHIEVDKKTGRLRYRRVYPEALRPYIQGKPVQLKRALGATLPVKDRAVIQRYWQFNEEWERNVRRARNILSGTGDALGEDVVSFLAEKFARDWHQGDERALVEKGGAWVEGAPDAWDTHLSDFMEWRLDQDEQAMVEFWGSSAKRLLADAGIDHDPSESLGFDRLCRALNDKAIEISEALQARLRGKILPIPAEPIPPTRVEPQPAAGGQSFASIVREMLDNPRYGVGASTKQACGTALRLWTEVHGDATPETITKRMVTDWLDMLAKRPTGLTPTEQRLPLPKLVERFEGRDVPRMALKTQKQHLRMLAARWVKGQQEGYISDDLHNPFKPPMPAAARKDDPPEFSVAELSAIFRLPVFTLGERPTRGKGEASFWMPLILLWTGARPEEAAQLTVADFADDPEIGRWMMTITDQGEHPIKGDQNLRTSKRGSGRRTFPVPQALIDLNLRDEAAAECPVCKARANKDPRQAEATKEMSEKDKEELLVHLMRTYEMKVAAERCARLDGDIVAADLYIRQLTFFELILEGCGKGMDVIDLHTRRPQTPGEGDRDVNCGPLTDILDKLRRDAWKEAGEPAGPPIDLREFQPDGAISTYGDMRPEREYARNQAQARIAEAQAVWEAAAREDTWAAFKEQAGAASWIGRYD